MSSYTEDHLVEQPAVQLMQHELGWDVMHGYDEWSGGVSSLGREGKREVVLGSRLQAALQRLNPELPGEAIEAAVEELSRDRNGVEPGGGEPGDRQSAQTWRESFVSGSRTRRAASGSGSGDRLENNDFPISLESTFSQSAETVEFTEIERLQDFTESTNFTAC